MLSNGENGVVFELQYENHGYVAHTILKMAINTNSDNSAYEYLVGLCVNQFAKRFPCFTETYGLFHFNDHQSYEDCIKDNCSYNSLKNSLSQISEKDTNFFDIACEKNKYVCVMIQHFSKAKTLYRCINNIFVKYELLHVLYQIYMPLAHLADNFTHYDLHLNNVLIYEPAPNSYIEYHYHLTDGSVVTFFSRYIAKIIDYGRSYFKDETDPSNNSKTVYNKVCKTNKCGTKQCGRHVGFSWLNPSKISYSENYIASQRRNKSHDMRLLNGLVKWIELIQLCPHLVVIRNAIVYKEKSGTPELESKGTAINNVIDAHKYLKAIIDSARIKDINFRYHSRYTKLGDLHVYTNGDPVKYEPIS